MVKRFLNAPVRGCLALSLLAGCATPPGRPTPQAAVEQIHVISTPVAVNLDDLPGADGFSVALYASNRKNPKTVPIHHGTIDVLLFDGLLKPDAAPAPPPLQTWTYTADQLQNYLYAGSLGISYRLLPRWGANKPTQARFTILVHYTPPEGPTLASEPNVLSMLAH